MKPTVPTVVLYPVSGMGQVPVVELAKLFLLHDFVVTVVIMHSPIYHPSLDPSLARLSAAYPSMSFHSLLPPLRRAPAGSAYIVTLLENIRRNNPQLLDFLVAHHRTADVRAVVLDFFCVTAELRLPTRIFLSSSAASLAIFLYPPHHRFHHRAQLCELGDAPVHFPGLPPIAVSNMPNHLVDRTGETYKRLVILFQHVLDADSIFINWFEPLESEAVKALHAGRAFPVAGCRKCTVSGR